MQTNRAINYDNSGVTIELRELIAGGIDIWDFDYPSYYEGDAKKEFEQKVIDHYFFRQIGQETPGRWLHYFRTRIKEIMPYYIQRYRSVDLLMDAGDPLESYNLLETFTEDTEGRNTSTGTSSGSNEHRFSSTPQGSITNLDNYLTEASKDDSTGSSSAESQDTGKRTYTMQRRGNIGVQPLGQEINVYRSALINVDLEIIEELKDLFLMVY